MRKLYAGLAAAAMTAAGIACTAGAAHATGSPWPSDLGYNADTTSIAVGADGTVYAASTDSDNAALHLTTTDSAGVTMPRSVTLATDAGFTVHRVWRVAVSSNGTVVVAGEEDDVNGTSHPELWVVAPGVSTGELVAGNLPSGDVLALSPDGTHGVTADGDQAATFTISAGTLSAGSTVTLDGAALAIAAAVTDDDAAHAYLVGINPAPTLWTISGATATSEPLTATPDSVAVLGTDAVAVGETDNDDHHSIQFVGGANDGHTLPLADEADDLATDGRTLWASGRGGGIETADLGALDSYTDVNPVPSYTAVDSLSGIAYDPGTSALYAVGQTLFYDTTSDQWRLGDSGLYRFAPTSLLPSVAAGTATISGTPQVGSTLTAVTSGWPDVATLTYEWDAVSSNGLSGGVTPIAGATQSTLAVTAALAGQRIVLGVTGHLPDHADTTVWSGVVTVPALAPPATQPVQITRIKPATIKASAKKIKLALPGVSIASAPGKVKVYDGKKLVGTATIANGKLVVKLKKHLSHGKHKLKLTYPGSAQVAKFTKKATVKVK